MVEFCSCTLCRWRGGKAECVCVTESEKGRIKRGRERESDRKGRKKHEKSYRGERESRDAHRLRLRWRELK